jgi:NAD(P)-dependent dehydrogenase (short-subunit alcohol dehydrogenase family)
MLNNEMPLPHSLAGRVILVTGASSGIGRAVAKAYAAHGATVVLLARTVKKLELLYDEIMKAGFPTPALYPLNLATATPTDYENLALVLMEHFGRLDGLLLNAATIGSLTPLEHYPIEQWYQVMQVNLNSNFLLIQAMLPLLKISKDAKILFTLANEGIKGKAYWGAYGVSKFAIQGLMQILADELETHSSIRVNAINPGCVQTPLRKAAYPADRSSQSIPKPEDLLVHYLSLMEPNNQAHKKTFTLNQDLSCAET